MEAKTEVLVEVVRVARGMRAQLKRYAGITDVFRFPPGKDVVQVPDKVGEDDLVCLNILAGFKTMALLAIVRWQLDTQPYPLHIRPASALNQVCKSRYVDVGFEGQPLEEVGLKEVLPVSADSGKDGELVWFRQRSGRAVSGPRRSLENHIMELCWQTAPASTLKVCGSFRHGGLFC